MKKLSLFFLALLLLGCRSAGSSEFEQEVGGLMVAFSYPETWTAVADPNTVTVVSDDALLVDNTFVQDGSRIKMTTIPVGVLLTDDLMLLLQNEMRGFRELEGALTEEEATAVTINGRDAVTAKMRSGEIALILALIETDSNLALVLGESEGEDEEALQAQVQQIIESITLEEVMQ